MASVSVNVHNITRVEGHGNIVLNVRDGTIEELRLEITESPRFYEAMLVGRSWDEAQEISCRICGICSTGHSTASLRAMEAALGVTPSEQTVLLRKLALHGEHNQSHVLHVLFLVAPDLLGVPSVVPLAATHRPVIEMALRLKRLANDHIALITGRHIHGVNLKVNGFHSLPKEKALAALRERLVASRDDLQATIELLASLKLPDFERPSEYVANSRGDEYALYDGTVTSFRPLKCDHCGHTLNEGYREEYPIERYRDIARETVVQHSHAKHAASVHGSYAVGALARVNINYDRLHPAAKQAAEALGFRAPSMNPFMNNVAQIIEVVHCTEDSIAIIDELLGRGIQQEDMSVAVRAGRGAAAVEVPRGILFHEYEVDDDGKIVAANLIIPTGQNLNNIEHDMRALVPQILTLSHDEIRLMLEMLVRAYDPCISCATHLLDVRFVG